MKRIYIIVMLTLLMGCAGSQTHLRILESGGDIRTELSDTDEYDYKVYIKNTIDFGWDGGDEKDWLNAVQMMFKDSCRSVDVLEQTPIHRGEYGIGKEAITWVMKVKCTR
ncbi:hypothetical protein AB6D16_009185 [Vibrio cyclitrophicus]